MVMKHIVTVMVFLSLQQFVSLCKKKYILFMVTSNYLCVYNFCPVEQSFLEHVISMATTSETSMQ